MRPPTPTEFAYWLVAVYAVMAAVLAGGLLWFGCIGKGCT